MTRGDDRLRNPADFPLLLGGPLSQIVRRAHLSGDERDLLAGYGYTQGNVAFDASSPIKDAKVHVNSGVLATRGPWICGACRGNSPR